jgi:hypothetical protein
MKRIRIDTTHLTEADGNLLWLALKVGDPTLRRLGAGVEIRCDRQVHCRDGEAFDGFWWTEPITLGVADGGISIVAMSVETSELTLAEWFAAR